MSIEKVSSEDRVKRIRRAAVRFANDYGPLPAANGGDEDAIHQVATRLYGIMRAEGLDIVTTKPDANWPRSK